MRRVHRLRWPRVAIPMCLRGLVTVPIACTLLVAAVVSSADAQGGPGRGRNRHPPQGQQQTGGESAAPKEELGPGEYSLDGYQVVEAINRGEGRQALAYYEKAALEAEQQGNALRAARALGAATTAAVRLGRYQKAIQAGTRALERSEEHTSELQSHHDLVCRLLLEKKKKKIKKIIQKKKKKKKRKTKQKTKKK